MPCKFIKLIFFTAVWLFLPQCGSEKSLSWHQENGFRWAGLSAFKGKKAGFKSLPPSQTGITFFNTLTDEQIRNNRVLLNGSGVAVGDVDNDGWADVYFCRLDGDNVLYKNLGNWKFRDITKEAGVACSDRFSTGATFADLDGDGDLDLLVTAAGGPNACFLNDGTGKFTEVTATSGLTLKTGATSMALADLDGDGDLDLYITNYKTIRTKDIYTPQELAADSIIQQIGGTYRLAPKFQDHYALEIRGTKLLWLENGEPDLLYLNDGHGRFQSVSFTDGRFLDQQGQPISELKDWGLMARFQDMDDDGDPDLYVCNDFESPDRIWINDGAGRFRALSNFAIRHTSNSSMAVDFSDIDRDGDLDFFVADMLSREHQRRKMQMATTIPTPLPLGVIDNRPQAMHNTLFLNRGDDTYAEIAMYSGVAASEWTWSAAFIDADLDGFEDLLMTTGNFYDAQDADTDELIRYRAMRGFSDYRQTIFMYPELKLPNFAFRNRGDLTFEEVGQSWGLAGADISHGMALGDLDNDGDLDFITNRFDTTAGVCRNETAAPRLAVRLRGLPPNTQGIGAKIRVTGGPVPQTKEVLCGGYYVSGSDPMYAFATGNATDLSIEITWRNGKRRVVKNAKPNRIYEIDENSVTATNHAASSNQPTSPPYFEDVSELIRHQHHEDSYDDFQRQPLLPRRLSQLGPGVSWFDFDDDGDDDLMIAGGKGGQLALYRNNDHGFQKLADPILSRPIPHDQTAVLGWKISGLLVGCSNIEDQQTVNSFLLNYDLNNGLATKFEVGASSLGPLALADYDGDGDLDLFVGGRSMPGRYPEPASSYLYHNDNGAFKLDETNTAQLKNIGMVSGAVFSDIDGDADTDLILAVEWGPLTILRNDQGKYFNATNEMGLAESTGWWNGVTTGDLDEDGRLDLIATNWGLNNKYHAYAKPPAIYYDDFDRNGIVDIVEAYIDPPTNKWVPERSLHALSQAMPFVRLRGRTHKQFGAMSLQELFDADLEKSKKLQANTLAHTVFFNRGRRFEAVALPREAQWAPAFHAGVADFDGDGHDDIFLSQNFFGHQIETPRDDAGRGLWLRGDGKGKLQPVAGQESGIKIYGEQRGAALSDYDRDGRIDLVVTQNAAETKLYHNLGAKPGLRVRLAGTKENPLAIGAIIRLIYSNNVYGSAREIHLGAGYWSQDSVVQVFGVREGVKGVWVRWPDGHTSETPVPAEKHELTIRF
ncbi:MAG: CRTAC1 family protein [candidate division KSB1 bacterium]|nr:CRTAC1 family protein [candidate division KSB1 bacterium]MDZ7367950.1 CRTAC1 family protein [candidate division KSB1 bacterium]MDZ7405573.1 CRTAC1 family protein [candidate division KSB1 bacterium]